jgi:hypothetical protein
VPQPKLNLDAPILPNEGLGGLKLRARIIDVQECFVSLGLIGKEAFELVSPFDARYHLADKKVTVGLDVRNGKIFMLSAKTGYRGLLFGKIKVGMRVEDAFKLNPSLYYDEAEEMILCRDYEGVSIDIPEIDPPPETVPQMTISAINVFAAETRTLKGQNGYW